MPHRHMTAPERQGLYDPADEHDACGMGFVAHLRGARSRRVVDDAVQLLCNLPIEEPLGPTPRPATAPASCSRFRMLF